MSQDAPHIIREKRIAFLKREIGIDFSWLKIEDVEKLCQYALNAKALELPATAARDARQIEMQVTLGK